MVRALQLHFPIRRNLSGECRWPPRKFEPSEQASRTHATLVEALNRHRGKGQQVVRV
jgi:hypothetical protein